MKLIVAATAFATVLAMSPISNAGDFQARAGVSTTLANYHGFGGRQVAQSRRAIRTAQMCAICRYGVFYCFMGTLAARGSPCFCPGQGWGFVSCF